jgi:PleD family two-component response regulator
VDLIMDKPERVQVLVVEDNEDHALLAVEMLDCLSSVDFQVSVVGGLTAAREHLFNSTPDCVLLDLTLPDARRLESLRQLETIAPEVAIVVLSGLEDELLAVRAVQEGAQDYLIKGRADAELLRRSIRYATERKRAELDFTRNAMRDSLTGLPNRALFVDRLPLRGKERSLGVDLAKEKDFTVCTLMNELGEAWLLGRWQHVA